MTRAARYKVHPAIGVARVGNAPESEFFLGPERPNEPSTGSVEAGTVVPPFKAGGQIKRQAARFRVWEYLDNDGVWTPSREVTGLDDDVVDLTWVVHLANRKAAFFKFTGPPESIGAHPERRNPKDDPRTLEIDPLPRSIAGRSAGPVDLSRGTSATPDEELWPTPAPVPAIESLGQLRTDDAGRLIVIPAAGIAAGRPKAVIKNYANNNGWFDDVGDGPINATLRLRSADGTIVEHDVEGAWLLAGPPDFAPPLPQLVNLYDVLVDVAVRRLPLPTDEALYRDGELSKLPALAADLADGRTDLSTYLVDFDSDVAPILRAALLTTMVYQPRPPRPFHLSFGGGPDADTWAALSDPAVDTGLRGIIFNRLRKPGTTTGTTEEGGSLIDRLMPRLLGDDPYGDGQRRRGLTLTVTQYAIMKRWAAGGFVGSRLEPTSLLDPPAPAEITPHGLDQAALQNASGGAFFPGIEVSWLIREPAVYAAPFRIKHGAPSAYAADDATTTVGAGYFSRQMAVPWLADFRDCKSEDHPPTADSHLVFGWWPSQRPDRVYPSAAAAAEGEPMLPWHRASVAGSATTWPPDPHAPPEDQQTGDLPTFGQMIANWWRFGFVTKVGDQYAETERAEMIPDNADTVP